jgi:PleD family two-component response regulator
LRNHKLEFNGQWEEISFSVGCTDFVPGETRDELIKRADAALYANKRAAKAQSQAKSVASA